MQPPFLPDVTGWLCGADSYRPSESGLCDSTAATVIRCYRMVMRCGPGSEQLYEWAENIEASGDPAHLAAN
jgi:hypothetical protein